MTPQPSEQPRTAAQDEPEPDVVFPHEDQGPWLVLSSPGRLSVHVTMAYLRGRVEALGYSLDRRGAAPDPVATPADWQLANVAEFLEQQAQNRAVASPAPLDVERLARAIDASWSDLLAPLGGQAKGLLTSAERLAAEYARLEGQPDE